MGAASVQPPSTLLRREDVDPTLDAAIDTVMGHHAKLTGKAPAAGKDAKPNIEGAIDTVLQHAQELGVSKDETAAPSSKKGVKKSEESKLAEVKLAEKKEEL